MEREKIVKHPIFLYSKLTGKRNSLNLIMSGTMQEKGGVFYVPDQRK